MKILILNAGSSSQKCCLYDLGGALPDDPPHPVWSAKVDWGQRPGCARLQYQSIGYPAGEREIPATGRRELLQEVLQSLWAGPKAPLSSPSDVDVVGHRVVHGGERYREPIRITKDVEQEIDRLCLLAPEHNPANLEGIQVVKSLLGEVPQVAVFDTAFHSTLPPAAFTYGGPYGWVERGLRKYGFHGISHQYCAGRAAKMLGRPLSSIRLIICHLGNGCSLAAIRDGQSVDTTMGFTPLDGLVMGARSGSVDPGLLIHLQRNDGATAADLNQLLNKESGLKGLSGKTGDMRSISEAMDEGDARARLAFDVFIHRLHWHIGAMMASTGPLDALIFTGGIGENSPAVRAAACEPFAFLGIRVQAEKNGKCIEDTTISPDGSSVLVMVIHTEEDWSIARECWNFMTKS